jgi:hypothetical protein
VFYWCLTDAEVAESIALMREANKVMLENIANAQAAAADKKAGREEAARFPYSEGLPPRLHDAQRLLPLLSQCDPYTISVRKNANFFKISGTKKAVRARDSGHGSGFNLSIAQ